MAASEDNKNGMDPLLYIEALDLGTMWEPDDGGQLLILADILACFKDCNVISLPYKCPVLSNYLVEAGKEVLHGYLQGADGVYWGTPTVVNNEALFPKSLQRGEDPTYWTKIRERSVSRQWAREAKIFGLKVIVTGLGTGDISVGERIEDMMGGEIVSHKVFGEFSDWVLCRRLK